MLSFCICFDRYVVDDAFILFFVFYRYVVVVLTVSLCMYVVGCFLLSVTFTLFMYDCIIFMQDPGPIYWANIATVAVCYGYGFTVGKPDGGGGGSGQSQPKWLKFIFKVGLQ